MLSASEQIARQFANSANVRKVWGGIIVNVKEYGAIGNGVIDDTQAIQNAVNAAVGLGKSDVWFPAGTYKYTTLANTAGISFYGDGVTLSGTTVLDLLSFHELSVRIDNIVAGAGDSNTEIVDARLPDGGGAAYATLKARLDTQHSELVVSITAEETARENADDALETSLTAADDAIEAAYKAADNALSSRINNLVISATGDNVAEVVDARYDSVNDVTYPLLKERLDASASQLADKADQSAVDNSLNTKRDKAVKIELEDFSANALGAMAGNATFDLLSIPQDKSVTPEKTDFLTVGTNLWDKRKTVELNKAVNPNGDGIPFDSTGKSLSDFIRIDPTNPKIFLSDQYFTHYSHAFYDEYQVHLPTSQADNGTNQTKDIPSNAKYIRVTFKDLTIYTTAMLVYGTYANGTSIAYEDYRVELNDIKIPVEGIDDFGITERVLDNNIISPIKTNFIEIDGEQLFDKTQALTSGQIGPGGGISAHATRYVTDYIEIDSVNNSQVYLSQRYFAHFNTAFFDKNKNVVTFDQSDNGTNETKTIPSGAKYLRATLQDNTQSRLDITVITYGSYPNNSLLFVKPFRKRLENIIAETVDFERFKGKKGVIFGDSIVDLSEYHRVIGDRTGLNMTNVGFGGTRAAEYTTQPEWGSLSFYKLADAIISGDWSEQETAVLTTGHERLGDLEAVDWSTIDYVFVAYGTNDYTSNSGIGDGKNTTIQNYDGALNYGMDKLWTAYPQLKFILISPHWRARYSTAGDGLESDTYANPGGRYLFDYVASLKAVGKNMKVPVIDMYYESGINKYTHPQYLVDGLHLVGDSLDNGRAVWYYGNVIASKFKTFY